MRTDIESDNSPSDKLKDLRDLQRQWLKILFGILLVAMSALWISEAWIRQNIILIDQVAYPTMLSCVSISLVLLQYRPQAYNFAVLGTVGIVVLYGVIFLQAIIWGYIPVTDNYTLSTFPQWFPLTYILLFLFIKQNQALFLSVCIYFSLAIPSLCNGWLERSLPLLEQKFPYLLQMMMSQPIYISVFVAVARLQTSFLQAQIQANQAGIDYLTNLANRRFATHALEVALSQTRVDALSTGIILIDIDRFKVINDTFGHGVGDQILIQVAHLLQQDLFSPDIVSRWGGEEFIVIIPNSTAEAIYQTAEHLRQRLAHYSHLEVGQVTASFGVALSECGEQIETLVKRADEALYLAKQQGRNRVIVAMTTHEAAESVPL